MIVIGLTGSMAMGKSEVARILRTLSIPVFDADAAVHEIYENGVAAQYLKKLCPEAIEGNRVDRKILSQHIAKDPKLLKSITAVIHPLVHQAEHEFLQNQVNDIAVIDSPLILEAGRARDMDMIIVVSASSENQKARALARPAMTEAKFEMITSKQMPDIEKRLWADFVIENNGTLDELETTTKALIEHIRAQEKPNA